MFPCFSLFSMVFPLFFSFVLFFFSSFLFYFHFFSNSLFLFVLLFFFLFLFASYFLPALPQDRPPRDRPKFRAFFSSPAPELHATAQELQTCTFEGPSKTPPKFHEKTPSEREREKKKKNENGSKRGKKSAKFWAPHPLGGHPSGATLHGPHPSGPHPSGLHPFGAQPLGRRFHRNMDCIDCSTCEFFG